MSGTMQEWQDDGGKTILGEEVGRMMDKRGCHNEPVWMVD